MADCPFPEDTCLECGHPIADIEDSASCPNCGVGEPEPLELIVGMPLLPLI